jgi:hypothetical protein
VKLGPALARLHEATTDLRDDLLTIAERHAADHDVYHVGRRLAERQAGLAEPLASFVEKYGEVPADGDGDGWATFLEKLRGPVSSLTGRSSKFGPLLLRDLRELELSAHACVTEWTIARQGAMAARDQALMDLCTLGVDESGRVERWLTTRIKETAPQVLMST